KRSDDSGLLQDDLLSVRPMVRAGLKLDGPETAADLDQALIDARDLVLERRAAVVSQLGSALLQRGKALHPARPSRHARPRGFTGQVVDQVDDPPDNGGKASDAVGGSSDQPEPADDVRPGDSPELRVAQRVIPSV